MNRAKANQPSIRSGSVYRNCFPNHFLSICAKYFIAGLLFAGGVVPMARAQISMREFRPTERMTLQFRWEAFDFTNTVTPAGPVSVLGAPGFGRILTFTGNRQQQIALKVLF